MDSSYPNLAKQILEKKQLDDAIKAELKKVLDEAKAKFLAEKNKGKN